MPKPERPQNRTGSKKPGTFQPGQSGNPGGRPKGVASYVRKLVGEEGERIVDARYTIAFGTAETRRKFFGETVKVSTNDRQLALDWLADRGFGKAVQAVEMTGADGSPIQHIDLSKLPEAVLRDLLSVYHQLAERERS